MPFTDSIAYVDANDVYSYLKISSAAPRFPSEKIGFHFAQRFISHSIVGTFSKTLDVKLENSYVVFNAIIIFMTLLFSLRVILKKTADKNFSLLLFSIFALSPFLFRLNVFVPGLMADVVFVLGLAISLDGISSESRLEIALGMIIATCGKQMSLLILPGILLYSFIIFKDIYGKVKSLIFCFSLLLIVFALNKWLAYFSSGFAQPNFITNKVLFAIIPWFFTTDFSFVLFEEHLFRIFIPSIPFLGLIFLLITKKKVQQNFTLENLSLLLIVLGPAAYAFLPGPINQAGNQNRYIASVMLPMALFTINVLPRFKFNLQLLDRMVFAVILVLFSYHHRVCVFPSTPVVFISIHLMSISFLFFWIWHRKRILIIPLDQ